MLTPPVAIEALLFASGGPIEKKQLAKLLSIKDAELKIALKALIEQLDGRGVSIIETENEVEMRTSPEASAIVKKLRESELSRDLGKASMETLAVIAYGTTPTSEVGAPTESVGGTTRGEIDWVRGVNSSASLRTLLMRGLIDGREDERDKRRVRYSLTTDALAHLGITRAEDLPRAAELMASTHAVIEKEKDEIT
ncbi:SMC-Scp complex subunit ScpB [Candidatus Kaiserbacteria bacterium]|nr:SMC-Scp complex subunit ScpB [Candidatus Kaiserbacteria bacterium]